MAKQKWKVIRISLEAFHEMAKRSTSPSDTPDAVLRRILGLPDKGTGADNIYKAKQKLIKESKNEKRKLR